jgi:hypothetical protein
MADSMRFATCGGAFGGKSTSLIKLGLIPVFPSKFLRLSGNTVYAISFLASLNKCSADGSGKLGASAHLVGLGGSSPFFNFLGIFFFYFFFFFPLGSSSSGFGISLPNFILGIS